MKPTTTRPAQLVPTELVFDSEDAVNRHYALAESTAKTDLQTSLAGILSSHKTKVLTFGALGIGGAVLLNLFLWTVVLPAMVALAIAGVLGIAGLVAFLRLPVWWSKQRVKAELEQLRIGHQRELAIRQEKLDQLKRLKDQAEANPIPTRELYAQEVAKEISETRAKAAELEGLISTQRSYVAEMKREYPEADPKPQEDMIAELVSAQAAMVRDANAADLALTAYVRKTGLLALQLKTMAGVQSLSEFLRGEGAKRQMERLLADTATQAANTLIQTAMSDLRTSVQIANSKKPTGNTVAVL